MGTILSDIIDATDVLPNEAVADELSYDHMQILIDTFLNWALEPKLTAEQAASLLGSARSLYQLALLKGEDWSPPEPERLSILGFLARKVQSSTDNLIHEEAPR